MLTLTEDLQIAKNDIKQFKDSALRVLNYLPNIIDEETEFNNYLICSSNIAGTKKTIRPFQKELFIRQPGDFETAFIDFMEILSQAKTNKHFADKDYHIVDSVVYTIQQSIGIGLDLMVKANSARKHVGNHFEELIKALFLELGISFKKIVLSIPYETDEGNKYYRCETDVVISPFKEVQSNSKYIHPKEIVISLKTTTKDRMPKIFIDKLLMERFVGHPVKVIGISQNDIQRKEENGNIKISSTFVSNLFMVYTKFLAELNGYYYIDMPSKTLQTPFNNHIFPFSKFLLKDVWEILES